MTTRTSATRILPFAVAIATLLFLLLGIGALGIIGDGEGDRIYLAVVAVFVVGTLAARFRPRPMALALLATAATMVLCTVVAFAMGEHRTPGASALDMVMLTTMYAGLFALAAWLFARSAGVHAASAHRPQPDRNGGGGQAPSALSTRAGG